MSYKLILAKADHLNSLEGIAKHAEAFEIALHDQQLLQNPTNGTAACISEYKKQKPPPTK